MRCFPFSSSDDGARKTTKSCVSVKSSASTSTDPELRKSAGSSEFNSQNNVSSTEESPSRISVFPSLSSCRRRNKELREFTLAELKTATKNFSRSAMLGEGGFGCVYRGSVVIESQDSNKRIDVAVKQLSTRGLQGHKEWVTEVNVLGVVDHPNLVKLVGYCAEDDERGIQRLLVYEYLANRSVQDRLSSRFLSPLPWSARPHITQDLSKFEKILDPRLEGKYSIKSAQKLAAIANRCLLKHPKNRPKMSRVLEMVNRVVEEESPEPAPESCSAGEDGDGGIKGHKEWVTEVNVLGVVDHPNLVKLVGYCAEDDERGIQRLLVYEYLANRSVQDRVSSRFLSPLPWSARLKIAQDAARGLAYLHEGMDFQIIFRDFKSSNILLDEQWKVGTVGPHITQDLSKFEKILDPRLEGKYSIKSAQKLAAIANRCLLKHPKNRPKMSRVLEMVNRVVEEESPEPAPERCSAAEDGDGGIKVKCLNTNFVEHIARDKKFGWKTLRVGILKGT
nr:serine/threonine-protein kinase PCRK1 isoform X2 [Ipomoea batatas]